MTEEDKLKAVLGEEYEDYVAFKAARDRRAKVKQARDMATAMISEDGKYGESYARLDAQLSAIWEKALSESRKAVGITEEEG